MITVSIVSHGHGFMVERLVQSLLGCEEVVQIIVTKNIPESLALVASDRITIIDNPAPKGFGANHNAAFQFCHHPLFCPLNPDIELLGDPFPDLVSVLSSTDGALVAPLVRSPGGGIEDSMRRFPTMLSLARKLFGGADGRYLLTDLQACFHPEWVAGMFMLFRSTEFARLGGFDEGFFLYYEDVDICVRAWKFGLKIIASPQVCVIHDAQRDSHRHIRHLGWHLTSMGRYFWKHLGRLPRVEAMALRNQAE